MADVVTLSRIQFAFHIGFHYLFPPMTIGLSLYIVIIEALHLITKNPIYDKMARFWVKIFGLIFALGVATGVINVFGIGTNWARFAYYVGDVFGALLGAEGVFAFTMEAGFLGMLLFGWDRLSPRVHFIACCMVALGAHFSATWIVFANSWMQTPAGYQLVGKGPDTHVQLTNFWQALFNPSALSRLGHVLLGCWLTGTFLLLSVSAYYLLKKRHIDFARKTMRIALYCGSAFIILQLWSADVSGRNAAKYQPAKLAALEGVYHTTSHTPMTLAGWSNPKTKKTSGFKVPGLLSFLVYRKTATPVLGLDQIPKQDWPEALTTLFQTYRWMIYMWGWMFIMIGWLWFRYKKHKIEKSRLLLKLLVISIFAPMSANIVGWLCAEMGRQPWTVYGLLKTKDAVSMSISARQVWSSLIMLVSTFSLLFVLFIFLLDRKIKQGPDDTEVGVDPYRDPYSGRGNYSTEHLIKKEPS
jgi:cytochrome d ubiquinol oxidase subunit I